MNKLVRNSALVAASLVLALGSSSVTADADLYTAKGCAACHGAEGKAPTTPMYPKIAGQSVEYTTAQMTDIKSGARSNGQSIAMKAIMANVSEDEIKKLAEYLSGL